MLFLLWASGRSPRRAPPYSATPDHAAEGAWLQAWLEEAGEPTELGVWLAMLRETGRVCLYGCRYALANLKVRPENLKGGQGIVDRGWFPREKALKADDAQCF